MLDDKAKATPIVTSVKLENIPCKAIQIGQLLGSGGYGDVYVARWNGIDVAVKQLHLKTVPEHLVKDFNHEAGIMAQCQFPNIVRLFGVCTEANHNAMVMEYMPKGSLYQVLQNKNEQLPWSIRWEIALDIGNGLAYLHGKNILHSDLKSMNVLLGADYHAKISDFGLAVIKLESTSTSEESWKARSAEMTSPR